MPDATPGPSTEAMSAAEGILQAYLDANKTLDGPRRYFPGTAAMAAIVDAAYAPRIAALEEALANEVHDVQMIGRLVGECYDEITMGRFSKPNTDPKFIIDRVNELRDEAVTDAEEPLCDEIAALKQEIADGVLFEQLVRALAEEHFGGTDYPCQLEHCASCALLAEARSVGAVVD